MKGVVPCCLSSLNFLVDLALKRVVMNPHYLHMRFEIKSYNLLVQLINGIETI